MLNKAQKAKVIKKHAATKTDTGSPQVQVALLTEQMDKLSSHLQDHRKDNHSRRGLLKIVSKRRRLLTYLGKTNPKVYQVLVKDLKIGKANRAKTSKDTKTA